MAHDLVHIKCPHCKDTFDVWVYNWQKEEIDFSLHDAPDELIQEILSESKQYRIQCMNCMRYIKIHLFIVVDANLTEDDHDKKDIEVIER